MIKDLTHGWQFFWGWLGGLMLVFWMAWQYREGLPADAPFPNPIKSFKALLTLFLVALLTVFSGLIAIMCDAHFALVATFEGASVPSLFFSLTTHYRIHAPAEATQQVPAAGPHQPTTVPSKYATGSGKASP